MLDLIHLYTGSGLDESFKRWADEACGNLDPQSITPSLCRLAKLEVQESRRGDYVLRSVLKKIAYIKGALARRMGAKSFARRYSKMLRKFERERDEEIKVVADAEQRTVRISYDDCPFAKVRQEPVGHGGFHHGVLATDRPYFRWVYDCGSWRRPGRKALRRYIDDFAKRSNREDFCSIDILFVSHFDDDHVHGLEQLLEAVEGKVDTVVIPYLGALGALAVVCEAAASGRCSQALAKQVTDPVRWFQDHGVRQVIQLRPGTPPLEGETPAVPERAPPGDVRADPSGLLPFSATFIGADGQSINARANKNNRRSAVVGPGAAMGITTNSGQWADWWFVPYAHPIPKAVERRLRREASNAVGVGPNNSAFGKKLIRLLKTKSGIRKLKAAYYCSDLADANGISLSLYVGPRPSQRNKRSLLLNDGSRPKRPVGWLLSGDAKLRSYIGHSNWAEFFGSFKKTTGTLMLPHHGTHHNFNEAILHCVPEAELFATADAKDRTRPNNEVRRVVRSHSKKSIWKVSERRQRGITQISGPSGLAAKDFPLPREW